MHFNHFTLTVVNKMREKRRKGVCMARMHDTVLVYA